MTTTLEIMNAMLAVNGEAPVSSPLSTDPSAIQVRNTLARVNRTLQSRGWWFNKELEITLTHSAVTGEVTLPQNTMSVAPRERLYQAALVQRGSRLYNRKLHTYNLSMSVVVDLILQLDIEDLPETFASHLMAKAIKTHYIADDGDEKKAALLRQDEDESFAFLQRENLAREKLNNKSSPTGRKIMDAIYAGSEHTMNFDGA